MMLKHYVLSLWCHYVMTSLPCIMTSLHYIIMSLHYHLDIITLWWYDIIIYDITLWQDYFTLWCYNIMSMLPFFMNSLHYDLMSCDHVNTSMTLCCIWMSLHYARYHYVILWCHCIILTIILLCYDIIVLCYYCITLWSLNYIMLWCHYIMLT